MHSLRVMHSAVRHWRVRLKRQTGDEGGISGDGGASCQRFLRLMVNTRGTHFATQDALGADHRTIGQLDRWRSQGINIIPREKFRIIYSVLLSDGISFPRGTTASGHCPDFGGLLDVAKDAIKPPGQLLAEPLELHICMGGYEVSTCWSDYSECRLTASISRNNL